MNGKGSKRRPYDITKYDENYDKIFKKIKQEKIELVELLKIEDQIETVMGSKRE
jgi:hypothetical protein